MNFKETGLSDALVASLHAAGFETPTEIQEKILPHVLAGKDVIGESSTGSGKTLAFGCGLIEHSDPTRGLQALVLTPTRELAEQVKTAIQEVAHYKRLRITAVYGGVAINPQIDALVKANIVVATPGRFLDHLQRGTIDTRQIKQVVLDEADRMLDMGFIDDVDRILGACKNKEQILLFSATISPRLQSLAQKYFHDPIKVSAAKHVDPSKLKQVYYDVMRNKKLGLLVHILRSEPIQTVMVFCNTRRTTDFVEKNLRANRLGAIAIHGGLSQSKRTQILRMFSEARVKVMVCTDVAARGLHIDDVSHIINYELPKDPTDYVHRIGRTARAGEHGKVNILCDFDYDNFTRILREHDTFTIEKMQTPETERVIVMRDTIQRGPPRDGMRYGGRGERRPFRQRRRE